MTGAAVERIAQYKVLKRVGRGGMGIVYRAVDERDGRVVALKVIRGTEAAADESAPHVDEARMRFAREAEILRGLLHVNVVSFYEIGEEDGTPYLAMEFLEGVPLTHFAGRPYGETLPLLIQASHGMEYLASRGIVHRDLSPDNVFVIERGGERIVKLLDFGVAKLFEAATGLESLTATGFFLGKVAYGSPEQLGSLGHGAPVDWRSDVYSLGVIFYQVLAGRKPFEGKAPVEYIAAHLHTPAPPVAAPSGMPALPMELVRLIGQMLEKRREDRPKSYREIVDRLVAVLREAPAAAFLATARAAASPPTASDRPTGPTGLVLGSSGSRSRSLMTRLVRVPLARTAAGIVLLAALLGLAVATWIRRPPAPAVPRTVARRLPAVAASTREESSRASSPALHNASATPPAVVEKTAATGGIRILATPYARVVSVSNVSTGKGVPLSDGATTPYVLTGLAPGTYRVLLSCPGLDERTLEEVVQVSPGASALLARSFLPPSALVETLR